MPPTDDIQRYLTGVWRMMRGREDGLDLLDISIDGFWNSFFAMVLAAPVLCVGWVNYANEIALAGDDLAVRGGIVFRLAVADIAAWLAPVVGLAAVAGPAGMGDRFVHYVIASNWGSVIAVWLMLPPSLLELAGFRGDASIGLVAVALFAVASVLTWRLTNSALRKGSGAASLLFFGMLFAAIFVLYTTQSLLGVLPDIPGQG